MFISPLNNDHAYDLPQAYFPPDFIGLTPCIVRAHLLLLIHLHLFYQVFANKSFQSLFSSKKKKNRIRNVSDTHIMYPAPWVRYAVDLPCTLPTAPVSRSFPGKLKLRSTAPPLPPLPTVSKAVHHNRST